MQGPDLFTINLASEIPSVPSAYSSLPTSPVDSLVNLETTGTMFTPSPTTTPTSTTGEPLPSIGAPGHWSLGPNLTNPNTYADLSASHSSVQTSMPFTLPMTSPPITLAGTTVPTQASTVSSPTGDANRMAQCLASIERNRKATQAYYGSISKTQTPSQSLPSQPSFHPYYMNGDPMHASMPISPTATGGVGMHGSAPPVTMPYPMPRQGFGYPTGMICTYAMPHIPPEEPPDSPHDLDSSPDESDDEQGGRRKKTNDRASKSARSIGQQRSRYLPDPASKSLRR